MKAEIKDYVSTDVESFWEWQPDDPTDVILNIDIYIGPENDDFQQIFQFVLVTPNALSRLLESQPILNGRHYWFMESFDWESLEQELERVVRECVGNNWEEVAALLSRHFHWEYEDHKYLD